MTMLAISRSTFALIVVGALSLLFLLLVAGAFLRARLAKAVLEEEREGGRRPQAAPRKAPKPLSRRDFFRGSLLGSLGLFAAQFGGATLAFLYPNITGGFGVTINAGGVDDIKRQIQQNRSPFYLGAGRFYVVPYDVDPVPALYTGFAAEGLMALYQRCVHLGCRVPFCGSSQWFECPCHGSKYNRAGEYQAGPAPTGLQHFPITVEGGNVMVLTDPGQAVAPPRGTNTIHQNPEGPLCV